MGIKRGTPRAGAVPARTTGAAAAGGPAPLASSGVLSEERTWDQLPLIPALVIAFSLIGIGIAAYLTIVHYAKLPLACPSVGGAFNCELVTSSQYSVVGSSTVPITVPGIAWFVVSGAMAAVAALSWWGWLREPDWLASLHLLWCVAGVAFVIYLIYVESSKLHAFCAWCSGVHALVILTFIAVFARWQQVMAGRAVGARR